MIPTETTAELRPLDDGGYYSDDEDFMDEEDDASKQSGPKNDPEWQFFDTAKVYTQAGSGGTRGGTTNAVRTYNRTIASSKAAVFSSCR